MEVYIWAFSVQTIKASSGVGLSLCWLYIGLLATTAGTCCALGALRDSFAAARSTHPRPLVHLTRTFSLPRPACAQFCTGCQGLFCGTSIPEIQCHFIP